MEGRLFTPVGVAYIVSILASLLVALMVTPVLCYWLLPNAKSVAVAKDGWLVGRLKNGTEWLIRLSLARPVGLTALFGSLVIASLALLSTRGTEFLPPFNEGSAMVNLVLPPGTSLEKTSEFGRRLERLIKEVPGVAHFGRLTGRSEGDEHVHNVNFSLVLISFDPDSTRSREEVIGDIRARIALEFPGVVATTEQPLAHTLSHMLSGVSAQVAIKVFGDDLPTLRRIQKQVETAIASVAGVIDVFPEPQVLVERVEVQSAARGSGPPRPRRVQHRRDDRARPGRRGGLAPPRRAVPVPDHRPPGAQGPEEPRQHPEPAGSQPGRRPPHAGRPRRRPARTHVQQREPGKRVAPRRRGAQRGGTVARARSWPTWSRALLPVRASLPIGYSIRISGQFEAQEEATRVIGLLSIASLVVMFLVLYMHFRSANLALQTLSKVPFAFIGAVAVIFLTGQNLSVATLVGLVALAGIATRNTVLLIDHYLHLMRDEGMPFDRAMIIHAGRQRIVPVLMTALTTGIALIPIVLAPGEAGRELLYPVASVIVGGLISSTLLDVLITPGIFWLFGRKPAEAYAIRPAAADAATERLAAELEALSPSENPA